MFRGRGFPFAHLQYARAIGQLERIVSRKLAERAAFPSFVALSLTLYLPAGSGFPSLLVPYHVLENDDAVAVNDRTTREEEFTTRSVHLSVDEPFAVHFTDSRTGRRDDLDCRGEKILGSPIE